MRDSIDLYCANKRIHYVSSLCLLLICIKYSIGNESTCFYQAAVDRNIDKIGFHRNIYYNLSLASNCPVENCKLCLQEVIPPGLFVNKDQLNDLQRLNRLIATVDGDVDIEAPARESPSLIVRIFNKLHPTDSPNKYTGSATLPVHLRYQDPQPGGGFRNFTLNRPELYVHCTNVPKYHTEGVYHTACAGTENEPLPFLKIPYELNNEGYDLEISVPVGDSDMTVIVYAGTYGVAIAGTLYIAGVLYKV